jgi:EmrB/QacA subfamily drug resistance transporter
MQESSVDYGRKWYVMAAVASSILLVAIDASIVNVALPTLVRELDSEFATVQWVVLAYLLTQATLMPGLGRLGDMVGKKWIFTTGFVIFTIGSVLCGLAPTITWLITFRVVQAIGGAMTLALGHGIVTEAFPHDQRGQALGINGAAIAVGIVIGPTLGGLILDLLAWPWIFLVNLPVGFAGTLLALRYVPAFKPVGPQQFDFYGAVSLCISLLALLLALTLGQQLGFRDRRIVLLFVIWVAFLLAFIAVEFQIKQPMIDLRLFSNLRFSVNLATGFLTFLAVAGALILMPFYLENVLGYTIRQVGLLLAIVPLALGISAPISGALSDRFGTRPITSLGLLALTMGYYSLSSINQETTSLGHVLRFLPIGIGIGVFQSPNNSAVMGTVSRDRLGVASGLLAISRILGQTTGIALLGAWWAGRVVHHAGARLPGGATRAPIASQIAGLHDAFLTMAALMVLALLISGLGLVWERRARWSTTNSF